MTVRPSDAGFRPLVAAVAAPDARADHSTGCTAYGNVPQTVEVASATGFLVVRIPVDGCGHYQAGVVAALANARAGGH